MNRIRTLSLIVSLSLFSIARAAVIQEVNCNQITSKSSIYTVLDKDENSLSGWSHIKAENSEFAALGLSDNDYQISHDKHVEDPDCTDAKVQNAILVVKLSDWTRQHANGFETILINPNITFSEIDAVLIDLRINKNGTVIPSVESLQQRYHQYLDADQLQQLDNGKVNLGFTLFEEGALDQSTSSLNVEYFLEIDQQSYFDQWLRITIPLTEFSAYLQKNYANTEVSISDFSDTLISGFRLNPETKFGKQIRNLLGDQWSESIPESFKEMSISIRRIELLAVD